MINVQHLTLLFASILIQLALPGCSDDGCPATEEREVMVEDDALAAALEDGELSLDECCSFCLAHLAELSTTSATATDPCDTHPYNHPPLLGCSTIEGHENLVLCSFKYECPGGRRPAGLVSEGRSAAEDACARWFAEVAHLEAASVPAFERLAAELAVYGAPEELVAAARRAAVDEARHAALVGAIAARVGGRPSAVEIVDVGRRSLKDLAVENTVEGCVRETWAALVAAHQAQAAEDPEVRACMAEIAADEAAHAALAWAIDAWISERLDAEARRDVHGARAEAALALRGASGPDPTLCAQAGLPNAETALRLWGALDRQLWSVV